MDRKDLPRLNNILNCLSVRNRNKFSEIFYKNMNQIDERFIAGRQQDAAELLNKLNYNNNQQIHTVYGWLVCYKKMSRLNIYEKI